MICEKVTEKFTPNQKKQLLIFLLTLRSVSRKKKLTETNPKETAMIFFSSWDYIYII